MKWYNRPILCWWITLKLAVVPVINYLFCCTSRSLIFSIEGKNSNWLLNYMWYVGCVFDGPTSIGTGLSICDADPGDQISILATSQCLDPNELIKVSANHADVTRRKKVDPIDPLTGWPSSSGGPCTTTSSFSIRNYQHFFSCCKLQPRIF